MLELPCENLEELGSRRPELVLEEIDMFLDLIVVVSREQLLLQVFSRRSEIGHELHSSTDDLVAAFCDDWHVLVWTDSTELLVCLVFFTQTVNVFKLVALA